MKSKKVSINIIQNTPIKIPDRFQSKNDIVQYTIEKLRSVCHVDEQQKLIKRLPEHLTDSSNSEFITSLLTYLFLTIDSKHPIRKTISRILLSANNNLVRKTLSDNILDLIKIGEAEKYCVSRSRYEIITSLQNCFNNFPPGIESISNVTDYVTPYMIDLFLNLVDILSSDNKSQIKILDIHSHIYNITKLLVSLLQQCTLSNVLPDYSTKLMLASYKIIIDDYISFDAKCNCGVLMVIAVVHMPDHAMTDFKLKACLMLLKLDKTEDKEGLFNFKDIIKNYTANLCIYLGILNVVPENVLCEEVIDGIPVISFIFGKLVDCAKRCTGKPTQMLEVSRGLILITKIMNTIPLSYIEPMFSRSLDYVWMHLDHFVDTVRHSAKIILENLVKLAYRHYRNGYTNLLKMILTNMIDLLVNRCTHYVALTTLSSETGCSFLLEQFSHLPFILLINIGDSSVAPQICNTYEFLMSQHAKEEHNTNKWLELWVDLVKPLLSRSVAPATVFYQRLLISAYRIQPLVLQSIIHYQHQNGANELGALLGCLRVARKSGLPVFLKDNSELNSNESKKKCWRGYIEYEFLELMMCHQSDEVRVSTLALVIESQKSTEIFSTWELDFLKKYFFYNVTTQMPNTRQQIIALYKKAFIRIKESMAVLVRHIATICNKIKAEVDSIQEGVLEELQLYKKQEISYKVFMETFFQEYLCSGFHSGFNYQRRSTCLELMVFMLNEKCIEPEELERKWKVTDTMILLEVLCDSYESNIAMAYDILTKLPPTAFEFLHSKECIRSHILQTIALASAIKPTSATAAGYMLPIFLMSPYAREVILDIMEQQAGFDDIYVLTVALFIHLIEKGVKLAKKNILEAVRRTPVYGYILCIRHLIEKRNFSACEHWEYLVTQLVSTCKAVDEIVSPIVNNSSPEGYMPMDNEVISNNKKDEIVTSQMVLVYAWRTTKEVSLLLGELTLNVPDKCYKTGKLLLTNDIMSSISEHFLNLFLETKHRGAYEQAYLGFCKFCEKLWTSSNHFQTWPKLWITNILNVLKGENENTFHKLCPTRRSAGLPFMIQGIIITEPKSLGNENFHSCMKTLLNIASNTSEQNVKSRIHAMNILRSLYRNNQLGELVSQYIAEGVIIALDSFNHNKWGVRNSATLLFATLIIRIFGVQRNRDIEELSLKNRLSSRVFFMRYTTLSDFLLEQIIKGINNNEDTAALHSVLLILERLYPCNTEEENQLEKYMVHVTNCLHNCMYRIRALAAQASTSLIPNLEVVSYIKSILIMLSDVTHTDNYCQGLILQITYLLRCLTKGHAPLNVPNLIEPTFWIPLSIGKYITHYTVAMYFDMLVSLTSAFLKTCQGALVFGKLVEILMWQTVKDIGTVELEISDREYQVVTSLDATVKEYVIEGIHKYLERKLFPVFYELLAKSKACCLSMFLMLQHYPCILNNIQPKKQDVLDFLMKWCRSEDDEMYCAVLSTISTFINSLSDNNMKQLNCSALLKTIRDASSSASTAHQRIATAQFLVSNRRLLCQKNLFFKERELAHLWNIVIILLEDDDRVIRDIISQLREEFQTASSRSHLQLTSVIAEKAREDLLQVCVEVLPSKITIPLFLSWTLRHSSKEEKDSLDIFDKGETNTYGEEEQLARFSRKMSN
ncbi:hypothetical protein Trydic_g13108 [Trypoxylus dichotomus]